jgi:tRNA1(Val) A37 N6-methylase TrmN6
MSFRFKQFFIEDSKCAMKVGTDGVLLGAWVPIPYTTHQSSLCQWVLRSERLLAGHL